MNFDGFVCEILFNTFDSFRLTVVAFMSVLGVSLVYPVRTYFSHLLTKFDDPIDQKMATRSLASLLFGVFSPAALLPFPN